MRSIHPPLRVLVVGPAPVGATSRGGMATVAALMAQHPDERFEIVMVPTFTDNGSRWQQLHQVLRATFLVLRGHADVVHIHLAHGGSVVRKSLPLWAARRMRVPAVIHGHSYDFGGWFDRLPRLARATVRRSLVADHWLVLGGGHIDEYSSRLQIFGRISVLYNAVRMPAAPVSQTAAGRVHAVALGRLGRRKGSYDLIVAIGAIDPIVRSRMRVTIAGDGDVAGVRAAVTAAGLDQTISVAGWLEPAARDELLSTAHVFLLPSYDEGLPMALLEAMASGLAPVTTLVGSIGEAVSDGVNGLLVQPGRPDQIASALASLVSDEHLRARLGAAARRRAADFAVADWYEQLGRLWIDLAVTRPAPVQVGKRR